MKYKIEVGKRYKFPLSIPDDGRFKNGIVEKIERNIATIITKKNEEWEIPISHLKPFKKEV